MITQAQAQEQPADPTEGTHSGAEAGHGGGGHDVAFPPMNPEFYPSQVLWLAITFGIFYLMLSRTILPRIGTILENRRDRIALDLEAADRMKSDADEAHAAYQQELSEARDRAHKIGHEAREKARESAESERKRMDRQLDDKLEAAQSRINDVKQSALSEVEGIATDVTASIMREVAHVETSDQEIDRAVKAARS